MQCLWLTLADPEPATNGQLIYSKGLIEAACRAGASLTVIGLSRPGHSRPPQDPLGIDWQLVEEESTAAWRRFLSRHPLVCQRHSPSMGEALARALTERSWDLVVFDSICAGWALDMVVKQCRGRTRPPRIAYLAHNHEVTVARRIAASARGLRGLVKRIDELKVRVLEHQLVSASDIVTSNTPEDCRKFMSDSGGQSITLLRPGYDGPRIHSRMIDSRVPRRAILVGSLDWPPKRISVEAFLEAAAARLANAGVALQIVGEVEPGYLSQLRQRFPSVDFVGPVPDVGPYMRQARLALVPDLLGGFKLKGLDYVFHRLPILSMQNALPGMPLEDGRSIGLFDSHAALADGVLALIDDFKALNERQELAYAACTDRFDWDRIGQLLVAQMRAAVEGRLRAGADVRTSGALPPATRLAAGK